LLTGASPLPILRRLLAALLTPLAALHGLRTLLAGLAALLPGSAVLSGLLPVRSGLTWSPICAATAGRACTQPLQLTSQTVYMVERRCLGSLRVPAILRTRTGRAGGLLRLAHLIAQPIQSACNLTLRAVRVGIDPLPQPVRRPLHQIRQVILVHAGQCIAEARSRTWLGGRKVSRCIPEATLQLLEITRHLLTRIGQTLPLAFHRTGLVRCDPPVTSCLPLSCELAHALRLRSFFLSQPLGLATQRVQLAGGLLLLRRAQQVRSFTQPFCCALCCVRVLRTGTAHGLVSRTQSIERLLHPGIGAAIASSRSTIACHLSGALPRALAGTAILLLSRLTR